MGVSGSPGLGIGIGFSVLWLAWGKTSHSETSWKTQGFFWTFLGPDRLWEILAFPQRLINRHCLRTGLNWWYSWCEHFLRCTSESVHAELPWGSSPSKCLVMWYKARVWIFLFLLFKINRVIKRDLDKTNWEGCSDGLAFACIVPCTRISPSLFCPLSHPGFGICSVMSMLRGVSASAAVGASAQCSRNSSACPFGVSGPGLFSFSVRTT